MDRINADSLRTFLEVARVEHLGRAAEALQADPSTVSRKIARLEQEVGVPLFERIGRSIRLTQAGKRFVGRAERFWPTSARPSPMPKVRCRPSPGWFESGSCTPWGRA